MSREPGQGLRTGGQNPDDGHVKPYPYRELDDHGTKATYRIDSRFLVEAHGLLGDPCPVFGIATLDGLEPGLQFRHLLGRAELPQGQRQSSDTHQDSKDDDGQAEVMAQNGVQHHQPVYQGVEDEPVPQ